MKKAKPSSKFIISPKEVIDQLLTSPSISKDEWKFLQKYSKKAGFKNLDEYLKYLLESVFDMTTFVFNSDFKKKIDEAKNVNELILPSIDHIGKTLSASGISKKQISIDRNVEKFPANVQNKIADIEMRIFKFSMFHIISELSKEPKKQKLVLNLWKKYFTQLKHQSDKSEHAEGFLEYMDSIDPAVLRKEIVQQQIKLEYFNDKIHILKDINDKLVENELIEANENFLISFTKNRRKGHLTSWLGSLPELLYFLYRLNNKSEKISNIFIYVIAEELFTNKGKRFTNDSLRISFFRMHEKLGNTIYLKKKLSKIHELMESVTNL